MILAFILIASCNDSAVIIEDTPVNPVVNDYLPLKVGAKYKHKYSTIYVDMLDNIKRNGECTWDFKSASVDTPAVYQVEQSFNGLYVRHYYVYENGRSLYKTDSVQLENEISALNFKVLKDSKVTVTFPMPNFGLEVVTFARYIQSEKIDTCFRFDGAAGCLKKNVGINSLISTFGPGNHYVYVSYSLMEGPYY